MKNQLNLAVLIFSINLITPLTCSAASLINGNFQTGDFTGWQQDVDGLGAPTANLNDFSLVQSAPSNHAVRVEADYWTTTGDVSSTPKDEAIFASTLYQSLDLNVMPGDKLLLSFDWTFSGENNTFDENFFVALGDGSGNYFDATGSTGFLINPMSYGSGTVSILLDPSFYNATGWSLEFQLNSGNDGSGSFIQIDNANVVTTVPIPASIWLLSSCLLGLLRMTSIKKPSFLSSKDKLIA